MDRKLQILLIAGVIITAILFSINIYAAGIFFVILVALVMSYFIMQDSTFLPDVVADLEEHAKGIVIRNTGNALATKIHVALVPENIEFDVHPLEAEESYTYSLERMIEEVKVVITFENERGNTFSRSYRLNAYGDNFEPLKPMIPLFKWK
jgi:hypothetical protein